MLLVKALVIGGFLTWLFALVLGSNHTKGGWLSIHQMTVASHQVYWSWPLFVATTGVAWAILAMMPER